MFWTMIYDDVFYHLTFSLKTQFSFIHFLKDFFSVENIKINKIQELFDF